MRVVSGRRSLGGGEARDAPRKNDVPDWDEEATTVAPMNFDVLSADDLARRGPAGGGADMDADTVLDDRSVDEILNFALGTDERPFHQQLQRPMPRASSPSPPAVPGFVLPPPVPRSGHQAEFQAPAVPVAAAPSAPYPLQYPHSGPFPHPDLSQPHAYVDLSQPHAYVDLSQPHPYVDLSQPHPYVDLSQAHPYVDLSRAHPLQTVTARSVAVRWGIPALALILVAGSGLALGKFLFADDATPAARQAPVATAAPAIPAPVAAAPVQQPVTPPAPAAQAPVVAETAPAAATASLPPEPITAEVGSLTHPVTAAVPSPAGGTITRAYLVGTRKVRAGEKLFEVTSKSAGGAKERALASKVKDLERLAAQDPVYQDFLERARAEHDRARSRSQSLVVQAPTDGVFEAKVARGDRVDSHQPLASRPDRTVWTARVTLRGDARPGTQWSCAITPTGGDAGGAKHSRCAIERIVDEEGGVEVTVRVDSRDAPWLASGGSGHLLTFEPPAAAAQ